jgi:endonuclease/exonuclease/phosphatase (EEP) superfamily protein YafD
MRRVLKFVGRLGALLGALGCAAAAVAGQGGRWSVKLDILNHFAPLWLAGGLLASALAFWLARGLERRIVVGLALAAVVTAGSRILPEVVSRWTPGARAQGERIKLIQFNAYRYNVSPGRSVDWLLAQDPDIVVIEEGDGLPRDEVMRLRQRYPYCNGCPGQGGWFNMILSKRPDIARGRFEMPRPDSIFPLLGGWSRFSGPGGDFTIIGVHLDWSWHAFSRRQRDGLVDYVNRIAKDRVIVVGDFNSTPWSFGMNRLDRDLGLHRVTHGQASWPGQSYYRAPGVPVPPLPYLPIDQIYAGGGWRPVSVQRGPNIGSDHYPFVVELAARK